MITDLPTKVKEPHYYANLCSSNESPLIPDKLEKTKHNKTLMQKFTPLKFETGKEIINSEENVEDIQMNKASQKQKKEHTIKPITKRAAIKTLADKPHSKAKSVDSKFNKRNCSENSSNSIDNKGSLTSSSDKDYPKERYLKPKFSKEEKDEDEEYEDYDEFEENNDYLSINNNVYSSKTLARDKSSKFQKPWINYRSGTSSLTTGTSSKFNQIENMNFCIEKKSLCIEESPPNNDVGKILGQGEHLNANNNGEQMPIKDKISNKTTTKKISGSNMKTFIEKDTISESRDCVREDKLRKRKGKNLKELKKKIYNEDDNVNSPHFNCLEEEKKDTFNSTLMLNQKERDLEIHELNNEINEFLKQLGEEGHFFVEQPSKNGESKSKIDDTMLNNTNSNNYGLNHINFLQVFKSSNKNNANNFISEGKDKMIEKELNISKNNIENSFYEKEFFINYNADKSETFNNSHSKINEKQIIPKEHLNKNSKIMNCNNNQNHNNEKKYNVPSTPIMENTDAKNNSIISTSKVQGLLVENKFNLIINYKNNLAKLPNTIINKIYFYVSNLIFKK